ncbi:MAG: N-acetylmuramidase [Proteobacteria bacterium]|nr:N-acetylmuramidase [Pseudomonadota bacterium]
MRVQEVIDDILRVEGAEYTNDPADSGGATKYGITQATLGEHRGTPVTADDVAALTEREARAIYLQRYFDEPRLGLIAAVSERIAAEVMDTGVNMGMPRAVGFLQRALNLLNDRGRIYADIAADGLCGPATAAALDAVMRHRGARGETVLLRMLNAQQGAFYMDLAERRPKDERFVYGWFLHRVGAN